MCTRVFALGRTRETRQCNGNLRENGDGSLFRSSGERDERPAVELENLISVTDMGGINKKIRDRKKSRNRLLGWKMKEFIGSERCGKLALARRILVIHYGRYPPARSWQTRHKVAALRISAVT